MRFYCFFEAGLSVSKEIPYNKHKAHYFQGFRALHLQVFSWPAAVLLPVGIISIKFYHFFFQKMFEFIKI